MTPITPNHPDFYVLVFLYILMSLIIVHGYSPIASDFAYSFAAVDKILIDTGGRAAGFRLQRKPVF